MSVQKRLVVLLVSLVSFKSEHVCEFVMFVTLCSHMLGTCGG